MEHAYFIDTKRNVIFQSFRGEITIPDALEKIGEIAADPSYRANAAVLTDLRHSNINASRQAFNGLYLKGMELLPAAGRKSVFVVADPMLSAFALLFAKHSEDTRQVRVFTELNTACDWLSGELGFRITFPLSDK